MVWHVPSWAVGIRLSQVESYHGRAILTCVHQRMNKECARQIRFDAINHLTGAYRSGSASWHAPIPFTGVFMIAKDVCNAPRHFSCVLTAQRILLNWNGFVFFVLSSHFAILPSICNWRFVAPKEISFVMVIQSKRPALLVWQINVRLHDNIQDRSQPRKLNGNGWQAFVFLMRQVCGMVFSSFWLQWYQVVVRVIRQQVSV